MAEGARRSSGRRSDHQLRRSLTWDRGKEMADHKSFTFDGQNIDIVTRYADSP